MSLRKRITYLRRFFSFEDYLILFKLNLAKIRFSQKIILKKMKIQLKNDIIIYELLNEVSKYVKIINCHLRI